MLIRRWIMVQQQISGIRSIDLLKFEILWSGIREDIWIENRENNM